MEKRERRHSVLLLLWRVLFTLFTAACVCFIFYNSAQVATESTVRSGSVTQMINTWLMHQGSTVQLTENVVRKLAHAAEYALLGFLLMLTLRGYTRRLLAHISWPLFFGLLIPVADETLQAYRPGRSSQVSDVVLDFISYMGGMGVALVLMLCVWLLVCFFRSLLCRKGRVPLR